MGVFYSGSRGDGEQRCIAVSTSDREDQEPVIPQSDAGHEHREEDQSQQQERGTRLKANKTGCSGGAGRSNEFFLQPGLIGIITVIK